MTTYRHSPESDALVPMQVTSSNYTTTCFCRDTGERGRCEPSAQVLTLQILRAIKLPPNQERERTTGEEKKR